MTENIAHPPIVTHEAWLTARKELLADEKALTRQRDAVNAKRRRLPMVRIDKPYVFGCSATARRRSLDLFDGRRQLIVYHFMFDPAWEDGCPSCTGFVNALGNLSFLDDARYDVCAHLARAEREARTLQGQTRLEGAVVFVERQRLQLRLPRHVR